MKKILFVMLIFFLPIFVHAEENISIEKIELVENNNVEVNEEISYEGLDLETSLRFFDVGDFVTYKVTLQNNDNRNYSINGIDIKSEMEYFSLESDSKGVILYAGKTEDVFITIKYKKHITNDITLLSNNTYQEASKISMSFLLEEYNEIVNPKTGRSVFLLILVISLVLIFSKKYHKGKIVFLMILVILFSLESSVMANEEITIDFNFNLSTEVKVNFLDRDWKDIETDNFTKIKFIKIDKDNENAFDISEEKNRSIIEWVEDDTLYIGSYHNVYAPVDSSYLFANSNTLQANKLGVITTIDFNEQFMTNYTTTMGYIFNNTGFDAHTFNINLDKWNVENVTNMNHMFFQTGYNASEWSIGDLSNWSVSNVTNMAYMFYSSGYNSEIWNIGDLSNWDTSKVTTMQFMFSKVGYNASEWSLGDISNWDTSNVEYMHGMFSYAGYHSKAFNLNLSAWNTSNVTMMNSMFGSAGMNATTFSIIIPQTNGNGINNTNTALYGNTTDCSINPPSGREFTLATP